MDRAAKLAAEAMIMLAFDKMMVELRAFPEETLRNSTRQVLADRATDLGFTDLEISAAVDQALKDAGTTP